MSRTLTLGLILAGLAAGVADGQNNAPEGWVRLVDGQSLDGWRGKGWQVGDVVMDPEDPKAFRITEGGGTIVNSKGAHNLVSRVHHGDVQLHLEFCVPQGSNSGIYFMGKYELQILDSAGKTEVGFGDCGGLYRGRTSEEVFPGRAPDLNASLAPGEWQSFDVVFHAPRFDDEGRKIAPARFVSVHHNGQRIHQNVDVAEPTLACLGGEEVAEGPLMLQGDHGPVAYRNIRLRALPPGGWVPLFNGHDLTGLKIADEGTWKVENGVLIGHGKPSHIYSERDDYKDFEFRARLKINDNGNSGMYFRVPFMSGFPGARGYEVQINSNSRDHQRTGSFYRYEAVSVSLVPPDTWFTQSVICRDVEDGVQVTIRVNDLLIVDHVEKKRRLGPGHVAFQQHHAGSEIHIADAWIRELN